MSFSGRHPSPSRLAFAEPGDSVPRDSGIRGFLYGRLAGRDVLERARLGAVAGAYACTAPGCTALIPSETLLAADHYWCS